MPIVAPPELALPDYRIFRYTDRIYKLVKFKRRKAYISAVPRKEKKSASADKLAASVSRTRRVILEYALCNHWEYFCTFTISQDKYDRSDLIVWRDSFLQWIRDQRKKGIPVAYLLVPELHSDGSSWHMHGFFTGVGSELVSFKTERKQGRKVPNKLVKGDFWDWPAYREKFGFCSFGVIRDRVGCAFYIQKYITKEMLSGAVGVGLHSYYASRGLNRSTVHAEVYQHSAYLDSFLENDYQFCRTGMTKVKDNLDWTFSLEYDADFLPLEPLYQPDQLKEIEFDCDKFYEITQLCFDDYPV